MLRVYSCLTQEHDLRLVVVAGLVCFLASFTGLAAFERARTQKARHAWIALAAFVSGMGIWSTHFIAMLAYDPGLPVSYDVPLTLASIAAAVLISGAGWVIALGGTRPRMLAGGATIGGGIASMHYLGMKGMGVAGLIVWDDGLVAASILLGCGLAAGALRLQTSRDRHLPWKSATLLTVAICALHFTGMAAAAIYPLADPGIHASAMASDSLAVMVAASAFFIVALSFAVIAFDRKLAIKDVEEARRVQALADEILKGAAHRDALAAELRRQAEITGTAMNNMAHGLSMYDEEDRLVTYNQRYAELYRLPDTLLVPGTPFSSIIHHQAGIGHLAERSEHRFQEMERTTLKSGSSEMRLADGRIIEIQRRPAPGGWVATHEDVTEKRRVAQRIAFLANHDPLTALPNRLAFADAVGAALARVAQGEQFALLSIDLDRFKEVNDTLGHVIGDQILKGVAKRLSAIVGDEDVITRLAGDEFAVLQGRLDEPVAAAELAVRIIESLSEPFRFDGHTVAIGASVGIALAPANADTAEEIMKKSDVALYRAKEESRGTYRFFEAGMDDRLRERRELETDLRLAIQTGQFELHYQPVVELSGQTLSGFEALMRWNHPTKGLLPPADFIRTAEETGLIIAMGEWALRQACHEAALWPDPIKVAVNLSPAQFKRGDLVPMVTSALAAAQLRPERLELEITESVLVHDEAWVLNVLQQLRSLGVHIAMDDFGTGYSSLSYLRSFPFSKIKIDRSFVQDLGQDDGLAIVDATIQLSRKLGMRTTAEGVETIEQMNILTAQGCSEIQGYHISRPVPASQVRGILDQFASGYRERSTEAA